MSTIRYLHPDGIHKFPAALWPIPTYKDEEFNQFDLPVASKARWTRTREAILGSASGKDPMIPCCLKGLKWESGGLSWGKQEKVKDLIEEIGLKAALIRVAAETQAVHEYGVDWEHELCAISYDQVAKWIGSEESLPDWAPVSINNVYMQKFLAWQDAAYQAEELDGTVEIGWVDVSRKRKAEKPCRPESHPEDQQHADARIKRESTTTSQSNPPGLSDFSDLSDLSDCSWDLTDDEDDSIRNQRIHDNTETRSHSNKRRKMEKTTASLQTLPLTVTSSASKPQEEDSPMRQLFPVLSQPDHQQLPWQFDPDDAPLAWGLYKQRNMPGSFDSQDAIPSAQIEPPLSREPGVGRDEPMEIVQAARATEADGAVQREEHGGTGSGPLGLGVAGCLGIFFLGQIAGRWLG